MNRDLILAEWRRSLQSIRAAQTLVEEGWSADAISRAYYATLHAAKAAMLVHDVTPESHAAVQRLFGLHLIRSGEVEKEWAASLAYAFDDRIAADYDVEITFTTEEAREECDRPKAFQKRIRRFLVTQGFAPRDLRFKKK